MTGFTKKGKKIPCWQVLKWWDCCQAWDVQLEVVVLGHGEMVYTIDVEHRDPTPHETPHHPESLIGSAAY